MKKTILTTTIAETIAADLEAYEQSDKESKNAKKGVVTVRKTFGVSKRLSKKE